MAIYFYKNGIKRDSSITDGYQYYCDGAQWCGTIYFASLQAARQFQREYPEGLTGADLADCAECLNTVQNGVYDAKKRFNICANAKLELAERY